jgi:hypothetical protein
MVFPSPLIKAFSSVFPKALANCLIKYFSISNAFVSKMEASIFVIMFNL